MLRLDSSTHWECKTQGNRREKRPFLFEEGRPQVVFEAIEGAKLQVQKTFGSTPEWNIKSDRNATPTSVTMCSVFWLQTGVTPYKRKEFVSKAAFLSIFLLTFRPFLEPSWILFVVSFPWFYMFLLFDSLASPEAATAVGLRPWRATSGFVRVRPLDAQRYFRSRGIFKTH